jgi:hypothetical protein
MQRQLVIIEGPDSGRTLSLADGQTLAVGRGQACDVRLSDPRVSRTHCRLQVDDGSVVIQDAGSGGGTHVNDSPIEQHTLRPGDVIRIGDTKLRYQLEGARDESTLMDSAFGRPKPSPKVAPLEQLVGQTFSRYLIESVAARGSSGMVFRARDTEQNRVVALKILSPDFSGTNEQKERFVLGVKTMGPIQHENIVRLYAAGFRDSYCWVAMEFVEGESMTQVIQRIGVAGMLDWSYAFRVAVHIGQALEEAGQHHIIHRNVTPSNILMRTKDRVVKLSDLTLAQALGGTLARQITQPGQLVGDVSYMAPERTRMQECADERSDIYGLGATLYALLTGRPPYEAESLPELVSKIRSEEPAKPSAFQLSIPGLFQDIVMRMLSKRPEDRHPPATALLKDLQRFRKFQNVSL